MGIRCLFQSHITYVACSRSRLIRVTCGTLTPPVYAMIHAPRKSRRGGGVAIVHKNSLKVSKQSTITYNTFENMEVLLQTGSECVRLCVVYRPPSSSKPQFLEEFTKYLDELATMSGKLLVLGFQHKHGQSCRCYCTRSAGSLVLL